MADHREALLGSISVMEGELDRAAQAVDQWAWELTHPVSSWAWVKAQLLTA